MLNHLKIILLFTKLYLSIDFFDEENPIHYNYEIIIIIIQIVLKNSLDPDPH